jgi:hypothetical protein
MKGYVGTYKLAQDVLWKILDSLLQLILWVDDAKSVKIAWNQLFNFDKRDLISYSTIKIIQKKTLFKQPYRSKK